MTGKNQATTPTHAVRKYTIKQNEWGWVWPTPARVVDTTQQYLQFKGPNARTYSDVGVSELI